MGKPTRYRIIGWLNPLQDYTCYCKPDPAIVGPRAMRNCMFDQNTGKVRCRRCLKLLVQLDRNPKFLRVKRGK